MTPFERAMVDAIHQAFTHSHSETIYTCLAETAVYILPASDNWIPVRVPLGNYQMLQGIHQLRRQGTKYSGVRHIGHILEVTT